MVFSAKDIEDAVPVWRLPRGRRLAEEAWNGNRRSKARLCQLVDDYSKAQRKSRKSSKGENNADSGSQERVKNDVEPDKAEDASPTTSGQPPKQVHSPPKKAEASDPQGQWYKESVSKTEKPPPQPKKEEAPESPKTRNQVPKQRSRTQKPTTRFEMAGGLDGKSESSLTWLESTSATEQPPYRKRDKPPTATKMPLTIGNAPASGESAVNGNKGPKKNLNAAKAKSKAQERPPIEYFFCI